jgi:CheY-like chemotaxis protein/predicted regulator of Ras-like GTPase activity (Roadblock/LC7/MglB family)
MRSLTQHIPDLVIVDLNLPGRGGEELFKAIRADDETFHLPFVFAARGGHPLEITRGIPLDPAAILKKPFTSSRLIERVTPLLRRLDRIDAFGEAESFSGSFSELDLYDLLGLLERFERSGALSIWPQDRRAAVSASFVDGRLVHARYGPLHGRDVLMELMLWPDGLYRFEPFPGGVDDLEYTIDPEVWEELAQFLRLVDRGRLNPFPLARATRDRSEREPSVIELIEIASASLEEREPSVIELIEIDSTPVEEREPSVIELIEVAEAPAAAERFADGPPPRRAEDEPEFEHLFSDAWPNLVGDPFLERASLPGTLDAWSSEHAARAAGSRAEVVARLMDRRLEPSQRRDVDALLHRALERVRGILQIGDRDGHVLASTATDENTRRQLAEMAMLVREVGSSAGGGDDDPVDHVVVEFQKGRMLVMDVGERSSLICYAPLETKLGTLIVECEHLVEQLVGRAEGLGAPRFES